MAMDVAAVEVSFRRRRMPVGVRLGRLALGVPVVVMLVLTKAGGFRGALRLAAAEVAAAIVAVPRRRR